MKTFIAHKNRNYVNSLWSADYTQYWCRAVMMWEVWCSYILRAIYRNEQIDTFFLVLCNIHFFICFEAVRTILTNFKCLPRKEGWLKRLCEEILVLFHNCIASGNKKYGKLTVFSLQINNVT
jgi:hypothetical protein